MTRGERRPDAGGCVGLASFFETYKDAVLRFILAKGLPHAEAENVHQETWLSFTTYCDKYGDPSDEDAHAQAVLFQTAKYRIADYFNATGRRREGVAWDAEEHDQADPRSSEQFDAVLGGLGKRDARPMLTHRQRTALKLVYLDGHSQQAAAVLMGITRDALEKLLSRARDAIAQAQQAAKTSTEEGTR